MERVQERDMKCWSRAPRWRLGPLRNVHMSVEFIATMPELVYVTRPFGCRIHLCSWPACRDRTERPQPRAGCSGHGGLQRNTRRMAAAANLAECLCVPGATGVMPTGSITHEAWNDSCINQQGRVVRACRHVRG